MKSRCLSLGTLLPCPECGLAAQSIRESGADTPSSRQRLPPAHGTWLFRTKGGGGCTGSQVEQQMAMAIHHPCKTLPLGIAVRMGQLPRSVSSICTAQGTVNLPHSHIAEVTLVKYGAFNCSQTSLPDSGLSAFHFQSIELFTRVDKALGQGSRYWLFPFFLPLVLFILFYGS